MDTANARPRLPPPVKVEPGSWLRRPQVTTRSARYFRVLAGVCLVLAFCFAIAPTAAHKDKQAVGVVVPALFVIFALISEALARRYAGRGLFLSADGVVVRNLMSTQRVALDDAERFSPGVPAGLNGPCPMLRCRARSAIGVGGLGVVAVAWRYDVTLRNLEPLCAVLNEVLDRLKHTA